VHRILCAQVSLTLTWADERLQDPNLNPCGANWPAVEAAAEQVQIERGKCVRQLTSSSLTLLMNLNLLTNVSVV